MRAHLSFILIYTLFGVPGCGSDVSTTGDSEQPPRAAVTVTQVDRGPVKEVLVTYGTVEFDPSATHEVPFVRSGSVRGLEVASGQQVQAGAPLVVLGPVPKQSPVAQTAEIDLEFAQRQLDRIKRLAGMKLATNQDVQRLQQSVATRRAALRALGLGGARDQVLIAPVDGVVADVLAKPGMLVQAGQTALRLVADGRLVVRTGFEIEDLAGLGVGLPVEIHPMFGDGDQAVVRTRLPRLHRVADSENQLVEALLTVPESPPWMVAGERVALHVLLQDLARAIRVPREALVERKGGPGVFAVLEGKARWTPVRILAQGERWVAVDGEVTPGWSVVTMGRTSLLDGMPVRSGRIHPSS